MIKLPIEYNQKSKELDDSLIKELELKETIDKSNGSSVYESIFIKKTVKFDKEMYSIDGQVKHITTDKSFLKSTQSLLKSLQNIDDINCVNYEEYYKTWNEFKKEDGFKEKYLFIDWSFAERWNHEPLFLQIISIYNILSPLTSLLVPFILLLIPFIIIHFKGYELSVQEYVGLLKKIFANHTLGKLFDLQNSEGTNKYYILFVLFFYFMNIYQSILTCVRFYYNHDKIHRFLKTSCEYLDKTKENMQLMKNSMNANIDGYRQFIEDLESKYAQIDALSVLLKTSIKNKIHSWGYFYNIGTTLKLFYELHEADQYKELMEYTLGFNNYYFQMLNISDKLKKSVLGLAKFGKNNKVVAKNIHYPVHNHKQVVKNSVKIDKNVIITGPNASGKTTMIKSILINLILSQQIGCGYYDKLEFQPYDYFYSYINIPDTLGRDSLFQAEARRCKFILDNIEKKGRHFCIFDELFSGTNIEDAINSAKSFIHLLVCNKNLRFILTTHFNELCKISNIKNMRMIVDDNYDPTYVIKDGINTVKCVSKIFKELDYPDNFFIR